MLAVRIVGARPQFMQVPLLKKTMEEHGIKTYLLHTGQHYDHNMSEIFFQELGIKKPDLNLQIGSGSHGKMTGEMIIAIESALLEIKPDMVILDGDTNSTLAGAIAAVKLHIPIVHVEAGVRDHDQTRPEEVNRVLTDHASSLNCAPIPSALNHLKMEGLENRSVLTGDLLLDCFLNFLPKAKKRKLDLPGGARNYYLATVHREENTYLQTDDKLLTPKKGSRFYEILKAFSELDKPVVFAVHPRVKKLLTEDNITPNLLKNIVLIEPLSYLEMLGCLQECEAVFTDSGGLTREAVWTGKPCVTLFTIPTWSDLLERKWCEIGRTNKESILHAFTHAEAPNFIEARKLFGDGKASNIITHEITTYFR